MAASTLKRMLYSPSKAKPPPNFLSFSTAAASSSPSDQDSLVSDVVRLLAHHRSKSRWSHLRSLLLTSESLTGTHFSRIALQLKSNPHLALRFFHFTLHKSNSFLCLHNLHSFSTIIHILARARMKTQAQSAIRVALLSPGLLLGCADGPVRLFEVLVKTYRKCDSAPFVFDLLVKSCLDLKKIDGAVEIVRMLRSRGISPQFGTCNVFASEVSKSRGACAGYGIFREIFRLENGGGEGEPKRVVEIRPNMHSFNAMMMGFYGDGDMEMVEEVWRDRCRIMGAFPIVIVTVF